MKSNFSIFLLFILFTVGINFAQSDLKVLSSDNNSISFSYTPVYDTSLIKINNQDYVKFNLVNGVNSFKVETGMPDVPSFLLNLGVPSEFGNTIEIINYKETEINLKPAPMPKGGFNNPQVEYVLHENYNSYPLKENIVEFGEFGQVRGLNIQDIIVNPFVFNPQTGSIKIYTEINFRINYGPLKSTASRITDNFLKDIVINYDVAKNWITQEKKLNKLQNSVLATGKWYRFEAPEEGIYKITRETLTSMGINVDAIDPKTIRMFNNSGKMINEDVNALVPLDLNEIAIYVYGENDGKFDNDDYILFYGRGTSFYEYDSLAKSIKRSKNYYSFENYFWLTHSGNPGKRMEGKASVDQVPVLVQTTSKAFAFLEEEKINITRTSRHFFGDVFAENLKSRTYLTKLDGLVPGSKIDYNVRFINSSYNSQRLRIEESGNVLFDRSLTGISSYGFNDSYYTGFSDTPSFSFTGSLAEDRSVLKFNFDVVGISSKGYLDYFDITYQRKLSSVNNEFIFFSDPASGVIEYNLSGFASTNIFVFDITKYDDAKIIVNPLMASAGEFKFRAAESNVNISKYVGLEASKFKTIKNVTEVANSNVHGITNAKYIIITHKIFKDQAVRLKEYRESFVHNNMPTVVVDVEHIYNEFGGGLKDPTALRNFIKYAYDNWEVKPEYVLLLGDGTYDYRNIEKMNNNFMITYQWDHKYFNSNLSHVDSYTTDDYFVRVVGNDYLPDLATGRFPVQSAAEAEAMVTKIISYESSSDNTLWQNKLTLVADDTYTSSGYEGITHTYDTEGMTTLMPESFNFNKIYMANYPVELTGLGRRKPQVTRDIIKSINDGTLILHFIGHGSPDVWTHEYVLEKNAFLSQLNNKRLFTLISGTCDFGYFDNPTDQSGAELFVLKKDAGSILAFTAARAVYGTQNASLLRRLYTVLLKNRDESGHAISLGKAAFVIKQTHNSDNDQKYILFGDPTVRLVFPYGKSNIDSVNNITIDSVIQIKALSKVKVAGSIRNPDGSVQEGFSGEGILTVFDSERIIELLEIKQKNYRMPGGIIFKGSVSVQNGRFNSEFIVPKDISYENQKGKIVFYYKNDAEEGIGHTTNIIVGGTDSTAVNDNKGPEVKIYFNGNENVNNAALVDPDANLVVELKDESGINTTGAGIGHKLEGILNNDENSTIDFSNYFTGDLDKGSTSGKISYNFLDLQPGKYSLKVKAWDVFNNLSTETISFDVLENNNPVVENVFNYPNPFSQNTSFTFRHNLMMPVDVSVKVYTVAGRLINVIDNYNINKSFVAIPWNGTDKDGNQIANGTYFYKVTVKSHSGTSKSVLGKMSIIK